MNQYFLLQVNGTDGYPNITKNQRYENSVWNKKGRDRAHGKVEVGDTLLVYCTASVKTSPMTLAFEVRVQAISADQTSFDLGEPRWFQNPLIRQQILDLVDGGTLGEAFRSCGSEGFNISGLEPLEAQNALDILHQEFTESPQTSALAQAPKLASGSPLDKLIETKLEQWIVENWTSISFGVSLRLYQENGEAVGQQYDTGSVGRIDLLCIDDSSDSLVVIELKRGRPSDEVVGQMARYVGWVRKHLANGKNVYGFILAPDFDEKLKYAASAIPGTRLLRYKTKFEVGEEPPL